MQASRDSRGPGGRARLVSFAMSENETLRSLVLKVDERNQVKLLGSESKSPRDEKFVLWGLK